jgi:teichuronic acid biosynthesis glycosyltransferase TuaC
MAAFDRMLDFVCRDPGADVLVVTNMWPEPQRPVYGIFVKRQVDSLRAAGVRCDVLYLRGHVSRTAYLVAAAAFAVGTVRWRSRYRLVHVHAGETSLAARFFVGPPMLVSYCGDDMLGDPREDGSIPPGQRMRAWLVRSVSLLFPRTITKSREMHERLPAPTRRRNSVIPNGVDTTLFRPVDRAMARALLGWPEGERVILFAGTRPDSPRKRRTLAEAAVRDAELRLGERVRLHVAGSVPPDEMPILMNAADCLLLTSSIEGSPNVVKEALMCNLPVVATPTGDVEELLAGVEPSYVCPPEAGALGAALEASLRRDSRSNGRTVARRLAAEEIALKLLQLYDALDTSDRDRQVRRRSMRRMRRMDDAAK